MRSIDGHSECDEIEIPLLHSLNVCRLYRDLSRSLKQAQTISIHLSRQIGENMAKLTLEQVDRDWRDWIFYESRQRLVLMARTMNLAFYMDRAFSCGGLEGFALLPLPSGRLAWEADNEDTWRAEHANSLSRPFVHGLTSEGKLVRLTQTIRGVERKEVAWQTWLAGQDGFGMLIMLASQLLGG